MRRLTILASTLLLSVTTALVPSPASAADGEFGSTCTATQTTEDQPYTLLLTASGPANPLPVASPSTGVITKARFSLPAEAAVSLPHKLKVVRAGAAAGQYTVTAESGSLTVTGGTSTFDVRLPVAAGDLLGIFGTTLGTLYCDTDSGDDVIHVVLGDVPLGATGTFSPESGYGLPVVATVEPDADKDGYGDITQDACPQSAETQGECPIVKLDSLSIAQDGSILVLVGTSEPAKVKVTGKATVNGKVVKLGGNAKKLKPGKLGQYKISLPAALKAALAQLPSSKFIKVKITATATDVIGRKSKDSSSVKLRGTR